MRTPAEYRAQAADAERTARQMSRADHRDELLELARTWRNLAAQLEAPRDTAGETEAA